MKMSPGSMASSPRAAMVAWMGKPKWPWNTGSPIPCAIICTSGLKMAQPKPRLSLMMWLYAVLTMVIRIRSAAALHAERITPTVPGSGTVMTSPEEGGEPCGVRRLAQPAGEEEHDAARPDARLRRADPGQP